MAPKPSRKVVGAMVKTTKKVVQETVQVAADIAVTDTGEAAPTVTKIINVKKGGDTEKIDVVVPSNKDASVKETKQDKKTQESQETTVLGQGGEEEQGDAGKKKAQPASAKAMKKEKKNSGGKRKSKRKEKWSNVGVSSAGYKRYLLRVLKQVHPGMGLSSLTASVLEGMMRDMFERIVEEAAKLSKYTRKATLSSREIQGAVHLVLPGELGKHAVAEGVKAVTTYMDSIKKV